MWTFEINGLDPIKVEKEIPLPFDDEDSTENGSPNPIVNMYRYKFPTFEDFGCEVFVNKSKLLYYRFIVYKKDSDEIAYYGQSSISFSRSIIKKTISMCINKNPKFMTRITRENWYKETKRALV